TPPDDDDQPAHNSKTARRRLYQNLPVAMYTIATFCVAHDISESFFHKLKNEGRGPRETHVGARVLITMEAAADWRAARQAETAAPTNTPNTTPTAGAIYPATAGPPAKGSLPPFEIFGKQAVRQTAPTTGVVTLPNTRRRPAVQEHTPSCTPCFAS